MTSTNALTLVRGVTDSQDRLLEADEPLAQLQIRCGGSIPGVLAIPELLEVVRQSRQKRLRLAREIRAFDGSESISGYVRVAPERADGEPGCEISVEEWRQVEYLEESEAVLSHRIDAIDQMVAELSARLDQQLQILSVVNSAPDLEKCAAAINDNLKSHWSEFIELAEADYRQPLHWRLLDGARATVLGSQRDWRIRLLPRGGTSEAPEGFELLLVSDQPWLFADDADASSQQTGTLVGAELTRVLRQPISRIIANAETIRARLAGPLRDEYTNYAGDIASAGSHLLALLDDLADLEAVEASGLTIASEVVDLEAVAARAISILGARSQAKTITIALDDAAPSQANAKGEFRRVLQILINILGNAINYSPAGSTIRITIAGTEPAAISVSDEGPGLDDDQQKRVFTKFERLGREGDGGSGLGLYISQRLAQAMNGQLLVKSSKGKGATFTLELPRA